jgi:hypothetical protein
MRPNPRRRLSALRRARLRRDHDRGCRRSGGRLARNEYSCTILARTGAVHAVIRGAADKEAFAAALGHRLLHDRLHQTKRIDQHLRTDLRPGLSVAEAGQRYCALTSPELYYVLTVEFDWTADRHREWLTSLLEFELLGHGPPT